MIIICFIQENKDPDSDHDSDEMVEGEAAEQGKALRMQGKTVSSSFLSAIEQPNLYDVL